MTQSSEVTIRYLTWLEREVKRTSETFLFPEGVDTVDDVLNYLRDKGGPYEVFGRKHVIFADINGEVVPHARRLDDARVVSFFSPIVGG